MNRSSLLVIALVSGATTAFSCKTEPQGSPSTAASTNTAPPNAHETLAAMDARKDVPLLPMMANHQKQNMRDHLLAVQEIVAALQTSDFAAIERSATRIGYSEQMGAMCTHMGAGAPGFTEQAIAFHKTADGIAAAAKKKDRDAVVAALASTLTTCTGCHAMWKQRVVDEATWTKTTSQAAPMPMHGGALAGPQ